MSGTIRAVQAIGFASPFFAAGYSFSASQLILPRLYDLPPSTSTPIFRDVYYKGAIVAVPSAVIASVTHAYLAYVGTQSETTALHTAAAVTVLATLPWTRLVMLKGIEKLNGMAESKVEQEKANKSEVEQLLRTWTWQNYVRSVLWVAGGIIGIVATFA